MILKFLELKTENIFVEDFLIFTKVKPKRILRSFTGSRIFSSELYVRKYFLDVAVINWHALLLRKIDEYYLTCNQIRFFEWLCLSYCCRLQNGSFSRSKNLSSHLAQLFICFHIYFKDIGAKPRHRVFSRNFILKSWNYAWCLTVSLSKYFIIFSKINLFFFDLTFY
jgi:hypothetical protein